MTHKCDAEWQKLSVQKEKQISISADKNKGASKRKLHIALINNSNQHLLGRSNNEAELY